MVPRLAATLPSTLDWYLNAKATTSAIPSVALGTDVTEASCTVNVYYTDEGPVQREEPKQIRGEEAERPRSWVRGETPPVEYTFRPATMPPAPRRSKATRAHQRQADVRARRGLRDAWCDPARARKDLLAAATAYNTMKDEQGLANAFIAHAQTRLGDAHLAELGSQLSLHSSMLAREEYSHAHAIFTTLLNTQAKRYDTRRIGPFETASTAQRFRPRPLKHTAVDAMSAAIGGDLCVMP